MSSSDSTKSFSEYNKRFLKGVNPKAKFTKEGLELMNTFSENIIKKLCKRSFADAKNTMIKKENVINVIKELPSGEVKTQLLKLIKMKKSPYVLSINLVEKFIPADMIGGKSAKMIIVCSEYIIADAADSLVHKSKNLVIDSKLVRKVVNSEFQPIFDRSSKKVSKRSRSARRSRRSSRRSRRSSKKSTRSTKRSRRSSRKTSRRSTRSTKRSRRSSRKTSRKTSRRSRKVSRSVKRSSRKTSRRSRKATRPVKRPVKKSVKKVSKK